MALNTLNTHCFAPGAGLHPLILIPRSRMVNGMAFTTSPPLDVNDVTDVTYVRLSCLVYILPNITCQLVARHQCDAYYQNNLGATHQCGAK